MKKVSRTELLFCLGWIFFSISVICELTEVVTMHDELQLFLKLIRYAGYLFCCLKIYTALVERKKVFWTILATIVLIISCVNSTNKTMLLYSIVLVASKDIDTKKIMKISFFMQGFLFFIIISMSQTGLLGDYLFARGEEQYRHALGFAWTTTAPILFFFFTLVYAYLKKEKGSILVFILIELVNIWLYIMTDSRMVFYLASIFVAFMIVQKINGNRWKRIGKFGHLYPFFPEIIGSASLILYYFYDEKNQLWLKLNTILSGRLSLGINAIKEYGFSLFGKNIEWIGYSIKNPTAETAIGYNYVDSSYLQLGLNYGMLFLIMVLLIYSVVLYKAVRQKDYYLISIVTVILVFSVTEPRLMNLAFNPFPLLAFGKQMEVRT